MTTLSYSQDTYPKKIVLNSDTLIAITPIQLRQANKLFVRGEMFDTLYNHTLKRIKDIEEMSKSRDSLSALIYVQKEYYKKETSTYKRLNELNEYRAEKYLKQRNWVGVGGVGLLLLLILL